MFDDVSPELGELDESAVAEALEIDADEMMALLAEMTRATDAGLRELARSLAARLFLDLARREPADAPGIGKVVTMPYRPDRGDLDIDASLDSLVHARAEGRMIDADELWIDAATVLARGFSRATGARRAMRTTRSQRCVPARTCWNATAHRAHQAA